MKNIFLLGASGSIGTQTLDIIRKNPNDYQLIACSCGKDLDLAYNIIEEFKPEIVCLRTLDDIELIKKSKFTPKFCFGEAGLIEIATYNKNLKGILVNALVGTIGIIPTIEAIKNKRDIALANKETLVTAGDIVMELVKKYEVSLYPIDSEHSAIFQCIQGERLEDINKLIITASGGSFREYTREMLEDVTIDMALNHPNWKMGAKITIDSSTMMNKGFEVIEAHHLFQIPYSNIETVLHKESIVHSLVEFKDCSIKAQLGTPDMRIPILYALSYPKRLEYDGEKLDLIKCSNLHFEELSLKRYPCLGFAYQAALMGGIMPAVLNASNDAAVELFLNGKITFLQIEEIIKYYISNVKQILKPTLEEILEIGNSIKQDVFKMYGGNQ